VRILKVQGDLYNWLKVRGSKLKFLLKLNNGEIFRNPVKQIQLFTNVRGKIVIISKKKTIILRGGYRESRGR
jgi:hypothetical protein